MQTTTLLLALVGAAAAKITFNENLPEFGFQGELKGVSDSCLKAYSAEVDCTDSLFSFRNDTLGPDLMNKSSLEELCTGTCIRSLNDWDNAVRKACTDEDLLVLENPTGATPQYFAMVMRGRHEVQEHLYWPFCITDQKTNDFCVLKSLPEFPPADAVSLEVTGEFCASSCRLQQSYLLHAATAAAEIDAKVYNSKKCPEIDQSGFLMNTYSFGAFAVNVHEQAKDAKGTIDGKLLEGTGYELSELFQTVLVGDGKDEKAASNGTAVTTKTPEQSEENAAGVVKASWMLAAVGAVVVLAF